MVDLLRKEEKIKKTNYNASFRHCYVITPKEGVDILSINVRNIVEHISKYIAKDKECVVRLIDNKILLFEFKGLVRVKINSFSSDDCNVNRIRYNSAFSLVSPFMCIEPQFIIT